MIEGRKIQNEITKQISLMRQIANQYLPKLIFTQIQYLPKFNIYLNSIFT